MAAPSFLTGDHNDHNTLPRFTFDAITKTLVPYLPPMSPMSPTYKTHAFKMSPTEIHFYCPFCVKRVNKDGQPRKGTPHIIHRVDSDGKKQPPFVQFISFLPCLVPVGFKGFDVYVTEATSH
jgi:hypothetical protein